MIYQPILIWNEMEWERTGLGGWSSRRMLAVLLEVHTSIYIFICDAGMMGWMMKS